jgi:cytochrome P450
MMARQMGTQNWRDRQNRAMRALDLTAIPYDDFAEARRECPVARTTTGAWYLARQDDVLDAVRDVETFVSSFRDPGVVVPPEEQLISEIPEPRHGQVRRIINSAIAAHRIGRMEPFIRELCGDLLEPVIDRGGGDLVAELIAPVPIIVISHLIGVPPGDYQQFKAWSDEVVEGTYATQHRTERGEGLAGGHPEFAAYLDERIAECRRADAAGDERGPDTLIAKLVRTEVEGHRLTDVEIRTQVFFLVISGNETTRHLIGNLVHTVAADAELFRRLQADPGLVPVAVEESLRHDSPVHMLMRNCVHDTTVGDVAIAAGDKVAFGLSSANRDERHYDDPDAFRLDRPDPRAHVAFGGGPHVCPGASLARLEARVVIEELCARVRTLELEPGFAFEKVPVFWANGPARLPVRLGR